jgi:hypothetical protein
MLGPLDQSGGATIIPQSGSAYAGQNLRVSAGAALIVPPITGPCIIVPDYSIGAAAKFNFEHVIDLLFYNCPPNFETNRPIGHFDGTLSGSNQTTSFKMIPCSGRKRVSIIGRFNDPAAEACVFSIDAYMLTPSNTSIKRTVFTKTSPTDLTTFSWAMTESAVPASGLTGELNPDRVDMILLSLTGTVTTSTIDYSVRATDF